MKIVNKKGALYFFFSFLLLFFLFLLCVYLGLIKIYKNYQMQIISDMDNQSKLSYDYLGKITQINFNALPLRESYPRLQMFYKYEPQEFEVPESTYKNPLTKTPLIFERGNVLFQRFCVPCHNVDGKGDGPIVTQVVLAPEEEGFPKPKDLTSESTRKMSDGRLYHILSAGQNLMFPINEKLSDLDKWCLVIYIRELQNRK